MGRVPEHGLSVAVACNFDPVSATALAARVADLFLPPVNPQAQAPGGENEESTDAQPCASLGGRWWTERGSHRSIARNIVFLLRIIR